MKKKKLFCEISPACYAISEKKEILKRHIKDIKCHDKIAKTIIKDKLPILVYEHSSHIIKRGPGIDINLQKNKAKNLELASNKINGIIIKPGEVFSFWKLIGNPNRKKGYEAGRVIKQNKIVPGIGGGLCNLGNTIHLLILHTPLEVTELHIHSDALSPDTGKRVPFSSGTNVNYNNLDYRFKNTTNQDIQICVWCDDEILHAEIRSNK